MKRLIGQQSESMDSSPRFFNPYDVILRHGVRLPHWEQPGATYFLTFRLADSIPQSQLKIWKEERDAWIADHPEPWSQEVEAEYHRLFSATIDRHLDAGAGSCILRNKAASEVFAQTLQSGNETRFDLHSFVVMPNHVHMATTLAVGESLAALVKIWKGVSARRISKITPTEGRLWQRDYFDRLVRNEEHFFRVVRYIRANSEKALLEEGEFLLWESDDIKRLLSP